MNTYCLYRPHEHANICSLWSVKAHHVVHDHLGNHTLQSWLRMSHPWFCAPGIKRELLAVYVLEQLRAASYPFYQVLRCYTIKCVCPLDLAFPKWTKVRWISRGIRTCRCPVIFWITRCSCVVDYAAAWEANFVYDTTIFILTVAKTWEWRRGVSGEYIGLVQLILRDGGFHSFSSCL